MAKGKGGFLGQDGLNAPDSPTGVSGSAGSEQVSVSFTAPSDEGGADITGYRVTDSTGAHGASGSASPITVTGLTNDTSYTFNVWAINAFGWSSPSDASGSVTPTLPSRVVYAGGLSSGFNNTNVIGYVNISSSSNAADFGDLTTTNRFMLSSCSSATRGVWAGGFNGGVSYSDVIDYVTLSSTGNAIDFGDLTGVPTNAGTRYGMVDGSGFGNSTRGLFGRGKSSSDSNPNNSITYITIASTGSGSDFGDLTSSNTQGQGSAASSVRGVTLLADGTNTINYVTIASAGNAVDFGDASYTPDNQGCAACSSNIRALFGGGGANSISYITIASTGNGTDFGDLSVKRTAPAASSNSITGVFLGGYNPDTPSIVNSIDSVTLASTGNSIDSVTLASTGNASDFGDLTQVTYGLAACSDGHGGLQ